MGYALTEFASVMLDSLDLIAVFETRVQAIVVVTVCAILSIVSAFAIKVSGAVERTHNK
jgi:hypothetical protein